MEEKHYNDFLLELECPVCTNYMAPPIRQCTTGHSICERCRNKLSKCPLCQETFTQARNLTLESLASKMRYPCLNRNAGCRAKLALNERDTHEISCSYNNFKCAVERCSWSGQYDQIAMHWMNKKQASKAYGQYNTCRFKLKDDFNYVNLIKAFNKLFWFKCKTVNSNVFWAVQYIGDETHAKNYFYEIDLSKPGFPRCRAALSRYCHRIGTENSEIFKEGSCISVSVEAIKQYVGEDGVFTYILRVSEDERMRL